MRSSRCFGPHSWDRAWPWYLARAAEGRNERGIILNSPSGEWQGFLQKPNGVSTCSAPNSSHGNQPEGPLGRRTSVQLCTTDPACSLNLGQRNIRSPGCLAEGLSCLVVESPQFIVIVHNAPDSPTIVSRPVSNGILSHGQTCFSLAKEWGAKNHPLFLSMGFLPFSSADPLVVGLAPCRPVSPRTLPSSSDSQGHSLSESQKNIFL